MNYGLAKELKDARFPQTGNGETLTEGGSIKRWDTFEDFIDYSYFPTLEELIEACGKDFQSLERIVRSKDGTLARTEHGEKGTQYWRARPTMIGYTARPHGGECSTPTEAVARLWLALNKNI